MTGNNRKRKGMQRGGEHMTIDTQRACRSSVPGISCPKENPKHRICALREPTPAADLHGGYWWTRPDLLSDSPGVKTTVRFLAWDQVSCYRNMSVCPCVCTDSCSAISSLASYRKPDRWSRLLLPRDCGCFLASIYLEHIIICIFMLIKDTAYGVLSGVVSQSPSSPDK